MNIAIKSTQRKQAEARWIAAKTCPVLCCVVCGLQLQGRSPRHVFLSVMNKYRSRSPTPATVTVPTLGDNQMSGALDVGKLKGMAISLWKRGGMDALVKVAPAGMTPNPAFKAGYCTTIKYIVGRTPSEMEAIVGLAKGTKLAGGADIFVVDPLPLQAQFELRGYTHTPAGIATNTPSYIPHPGYPPGLGAPQWELTGYPQSGLKRIATVLPGQQFSYMVSTLPPRP